MMSMNNIIGMLAPKFVSLRGVEGSLSKRVKLVQPALKNLKIIKRFLVPVSMIFFVLSAGLIAAPQDGFPDSNSEHKYNTELNIEAETAFDEEVARGAVDDLSFDDDEFSSDSEMSFDDDEFGEFTEEGAENTTVSYTRVKWSLSILLVTILTGFLVRYPATRKFRAVFMVGAVVILGFYRGGCPCMISSFQNTVLGVMGVEVNWQAIVWFVGLLPITYLFGKVWCGWVCHLGALQEFLYIPKKFEIFRSRKAQDIMRYMRYFFLIALMLQLIFTKVILFKDIGPFKVAFNLFSANTTGYVLLVLLLLSSVFIYRPFCKAVCPVGLILGWISKIPGASILGITTECKGCVTCNTACEMDAITRVGRVSVMNNPDCILCGDCLDSCRTSTISFYRKGKARNETIKEQTIK